jgi:hypothetical protein
VERGGDGLMDLDVIHFPEPEIMRAHALAFVRMMFAHARFEREVRSLQSAITDDRDFGEQRNARWSAGDRPKSMTSLINEHLGAIPEAKPIAKLLGEAIHPCNQRNHLAHGEWTKFNRETSTISVRGGIQWDGDPEWADYTEADILTIAITLRGLEAELYKLRREIEEAMAAKKCSQLVVKRAAISRAAGEWRADDYDVLADDVAVGRIFKAQAAPIGTPWLWTLAHRQDEARTPPRGYELTREAAMAAFAKSWRRE